MQKALTPAVLLFSNVKGRNGFFMLFSVPGHSSIFVFSFIFLFFWHLCFNYDLPFNNETLNFD